MSNRKGKGKVDHGSLIERKSRLENTSTEAAIYHEKVARKVYGIGPITRSQTAVLRAKGRSNCRGSMPIEVHAHEVAGDNALGTAVQVVQRHSGIGPDAFAEVVKSAFDECSTADSGGRAIDCNYLKYLQNLPPQAKYWECFF